MEKARILVVEDDLEVAGTIREILQHAGYEVPAVVSSGKDALSISESFIPDLVLMDIMINGDMDGIETAKRIKGKHDIPVIFLTASSEKSLLKRTAEAFPLSLIIKPFKAKELIANVGIALTNKSAGMNISSRGAGKEQEKLKKLIEQSANYVYSVIIENGKNIITKHYQGCIYVTGYSSEEYDSDPELWYRMIYEEDRKTVEEHINKILSGEKIYPVEHRLVHKDGSLKWVRNTPVPKYDGFGRLVSYDGLIEDITEKKAAEDFIKNILEAVDEGFVVVDRDYSIISANRCFCKQVELDIDKVKGEKCHEVVYKNPLPCHETGKTCGVKIVFETGAPYTVFRHHMEKGVKSVHAEIKFYPMKDISGKLSSVIISIMDITEIKRLEEQLFQSQKMEALGQFAGSMAHEFNNYLTAIASYTGLLKHKMKKDDPLVKYVNRIDQSSDNIARMTRNLLAFGRRQAISFRHISLPEVLKNVEGLLLSLAGKEIDVKILIDGNAEGDMLINGDPGLIEQALINLAVNARDAMPGGGKLRIEADIIDVDDNTKALYKIEKPGRFAVLSVSDSGMGMSAEIKEKIFEPFFTTKDPGKGTGLGLPIVYGIVKEHEGYINVQSIAGKGSTFRLFFPLVNT